MSNVSKCVFSVITVGLVTASRIILRHWQSVKAPDIKEWASTIVETASYESMLNRLKGDQADVDSVWALFWTYIRTTDMPT